MKKFLLSFVTIGLVFFLTIFLVDKYKTKSSSEVKMALVVDYAGINDRSFNEISYITCKEVCEHFDIPFAYFKANGNNESERLKSMELAIDRGYNFITCVGFVFGSCLAQVVHKFPNINFCGIDMGVDDFPDGFTIPDNLYCASFSEEISGYCAGYAAAIDGFTHLAFLGGVKCKPIMKYGYGFVRGVDAAAQELKPENQMIIEFAYGGQYYGDSDITKYVDNWYKSGTDIVFSCGGGIYTSVALAAKDNNAFMIGVDTDQSEVIDKDFGYGICKSSALKGIRPAIIQYAKSIVEGAQLKGFERLGLVTSDINKLEDNFVGLPIDTSRFESFERPEYQKLIDEILKGTRIVDGSVDKVPTLSKYVKPIVEMNIK